MIHDCRDCKHIGCGHASDEPCDGWEHMGGIKMSWAKAQPSKATFTIKPIRELVGRYIGDGENWIDPYAGDNSPCSLTNDINPDTKAEFHMDALAFCELCVRALRAQGLLFEGCAYDPPYSYRQVTEHQNGWQEGDKSRHLCSIL